jgi:hypothetical protein
LQPLEIITKSAYGSRVIFEAAGMRPGLIAGHPPEHLAKLAQNSPSPSPDKPGWRAFCSQETIMPLTDDAAPITTVDEHALLNEFKMAAQSLIEVWSEGESVDYPEELQRHIEWFKELLA